MGALVRGIVVPPLAARPKRAPAAPGSGPDALGLRALGEEVARLRPDALILVATSWVTTFHHYVAGAPRLSGVVIAGTVGPGSEGRYDWPGDPGLARALVAAGHAERVPALLTEEPVLPLDGGSVVALRHLLPAETVPIVPVSLCYLADLAETLRWGRAIAAAVRESGKRVILAVSAPVPPARPWPDDDRGRAGERAPDASPLGLEPPGGEPGRPESSPGALPDAGARHLTLLAGALGSAVRGTVPGVGAALVGAVVPN